MSDIVYQNKDVASKYLAENFKGKCFDIYGLKLPRIVNVLPTNLPVIAANEFRIDNLFELEDGSIAIIDYESEYRLENKVKYIGYIARVLERYRKQGKLDLQLRMIVIYTADVSPSQAKDDYDVNCMSFHTESAFLSELDSEDIMQKLDKKVRSGEPLTEAELMQFIILPLTYKGKQRKQEAIRDAFELGKQIADEEQMIFVFAGIIVFSDKVIDEDTSVEMRRWIKMTKVGRLFEEEKLQYGEVKERDGIIIGMVATLRSDGYSENDILLRIMRVFDISMETALEYMKRATGVNLVEAV